MSETNLPDLRHNIPYHQIAPDDVVFFALYFLTQNKNNVSALELKRLLGISYPAAWRMKHKPIPAGHKCG